MLDGLPGVLSMMNDKIIYGDSREEHGARMKAVFKRLGENGVTLNFGKCDFAKSEFHTWITLFQPRGSRLT